MPSCYYCLVADIVSVCLKKTLTLNACVVGTEESRMESVDNKMRSVLSL